jgi:hypothetical protein
VERSEIVTSKRGSGYASAINSVIESHKLYVLLCGAPLIALIAQLQWVQALDSLAIKVLITGSVFCFVLAGAVSVVFLDLARHFLAKTEIENDLSGASDSPYMKYVQEVHGHGIGELTEENMTRIARAFTYPLACGIGCGWLFAILALVIAIWS